MNLSITASRGGARLLAWLFPFALVLMSACNAGVAEEGADAEPQIRYGTAVPLGDGSARTYLIASGDVPLEVGVALDEGAVEGLPVDGAPGGNAMPDGHSTFEFALEMPADNPTPFLHATLDWNPAGHEPPGIYDRAHFDVHFYTISHEERMAIHPSDPGFLAKAAHVPAPEAVPAGYVDPELGPVPQMGVHWVDPTSPELEPNDPEPFTRTFLYGSWDGNMIFAEPMVTLEHLGTRPDERIDIPVAERHNRPGYHPASYVIRWDAESREYRIGLADLTRRE